VDTLLRQLGRVDYLPTATAMQDFTAARGPETPDELWICEHPPVFTQGLAGKAAHLLLPGNIPVVQTNRGGQVTYHGPGQVVAFPLIDMQRAGYYVKEFVYRLEEAVIRTLAHFEVTGHRVAGAPGIYVRLDDPGSHAMLAQRPTKANLQTIGVRPQLLENSGSAKLGSDPAAGKMGSEPFRYAAGSDPISPDFTGLGKIAALGIKVSRHCTYHGLALNVAMDLEPYGRINPCGYAGLRTVDLSTIGVSVGWQEAADLLSQKLLTYLAP
jgi:lipoyl(octanoyl) transferase